MGRGVRQEGGILQRLRIINKSITNFRFLEIPGEKISTPRICSISTQFSTKFPHSASLRVEKMWKNCVDKEQILSVEIVSPSFSRKLQWLLIYYMCVKIWKIPSSLVCQRCLWTATYAKFRKTKYFECTFIWSNVNLYPYLGLRGWVTSQLCGFQKTRNPKQVFLETSLNEFSL